jgi:amidase
MGVEFGILTSREIEITESEDARYLTLQLVRKRYTAVEVVTAFSKRAAISHQLVCRSDKSKRFKGVL